MTVQTIADNELEATTLLAVPLLANEPSIHMSTHIEVVHVSKFAFILIALAVFATSAVASPVDLAKACGAATADGGWGLNDEVSCLHDAVLPGPSATDSGSLGLDGDFAEDLPLGEYVRLLARLRREARFGSDQIGVTAIPPDLFVAGHAAFVTDAATWTDSTTAQVAMVTNPEPASLILLGSGIAAGIARRRMVRARKTAAVSRGCA